MSKQGNFLAKICITCLTYIAPAVLFFYVLSKATLRWHYMINRFIGWRLFNAALLVATLGFLIVHRKKIFHFLKHDSVKLLLIAGILGNAVYHEIAVAEFAILAYALFAVAYFRSFNSSIVSRIINNESRTPALFALICIITIPVLLILKKSSGAEQMAVYTYYFLVLTVLLRILEIKLSVDRDNQLLDLLREIAVRSREKLLLVRRKMTWETVARILSSRVSRTIAIYCAVLLLMISVQALYWKRFQRIFNQSQAYQGSITLLDQDRKLIQFSPLVEEVIVPIRLVHPFSYPLIWPSTGVNPVTIRVLWYEPGKADELYDMLSEDRVELDTSLFANESRDMLLKLKRPLLPGGRSYEVRIGLVHEDIKGITWIMLDDSSVAKMTVTLDSSRGVMPLTRELQVLQQSRLHLANEWGEQLAIYPDNYRSKIEILEKSDSLKPGTIELSVLNKGKIPWPAIGESPVQVGVAWIQKIREKDKVIYKHIGEEYYPLTQSLFPGKHERVQVYFDPFKHPDADEIWIGMAQKDKQWFYKSGDPVLKFMDKRALSALDLKNIQAGSLVALRESKRLEAERRMLFSKISDASIPDKDKFRSHISLSNASTGNRIQVAAGELLDLNLAITNTGKAAWPIGKDKPVNIGVLWFKKGSAPSSFAQSIAGERCELPHVLVGGASVDVQCTVSRNIAPGQYEVWIGPVHENVTWFYEHGDDVLKLDVTLQ